VHDYSNSFLISHTNLFEDKYHELKLKLGITDEYLISSVRGTLFKQYREMVDGPQAADTLVTAENIHEVKVALTGKFITADKGWSYSAFYILPPHKLSPGLNRKHADIFCKNVLAQRNLKLHDNPQLSWWLLPEIEKEFLAKQAEIAALNSSKSSPPMSPQAHKYCDI
jgi:hypothetical protein